MFDRAAVVRPLGRYRIVAGEVKTETASARRAGPLQHTHVQYTCTEPPSRLVPLPPLRGSAPYTRFNSQSGGVCTVRYYSSLL